MEWRIILPVVCVLGFLFVPGSTATGDVPSTNGTALNGTSTNGTSTNGTSTNGTSTNGTSTNATATNATVTNATAANVTVTNATAANVTVTNATANNATATNATATNASVTNATSTNASVTNATAINATATNATVTNATANNATATNATATNASVTNATSTNASVTNATAINATATNATVTNATGTNATSTNASVTNATAINATAINATATNATVTNATGTNATATNPTATNATATNATATNATATNSTSANSTGTNVTTTNATAANTTSTIVPAPNGPTTNPTTSAVTKLDITYSIDQPFKSVYTDLEDPETIRLKNNLTSQIESLYKKRFTNFRRYVIRRFSQGSIVTEGALEFNANNSNPNVSELAKVLVDAVKAGNLTIQIKNDSINVTTPASTVTPLFNTSQINVTFSLTDTFTAALTNLSSPEAIHLTNKITTQFVTVFMRRYANILRMVIRKFSPGSIVTDSALEFKDNDIVPKAQDVVNVIIDAAKAGSFNLSIDKKTVSASDSSGVPVTPLFNTSQINVTFSLTDSFTAALSNLSSPEAKNLTDKITTQFVTVFKRRYANILRMVVRKFSNGSIVTEGTLEFSDLETVPKVQDVVNVIVDAAKAGSFNLSIDARTVNATDSSGNSAEALFNISKIDVKFSIMDTFNDSLTNLSSSEAINRANNITTEFVKVFKRRYANILKMLIKKFRKGSIVTEGTLEFKDNDIVPKAQDVVNFIVKEVKAGSFSFPVDEKSITATDSSGNFATSHGSAPVISSMFTVLCMALASLLLSGVMHQ